MDKRNLNKRFFLNVYLLILLWTTLTEASDTSADENLVPKIQINLAIKRWWWDHKWYWYLTPDLAIDSQNGNVTIHNVSCLEEVDEKDDCSSGAEIISLTKNTNYFKCWTQLYTGACDNQPANFTVIVDNTIQLRLQRNWDWNEVSTVQLGCVQSSHTLLVNNKESNALLYRWKQVRNKIRFQKNQSSSESNWVNISTSQSSHMITVFYCKSDTTTTTVTSPTISRASSPSTSESWRTTIKSYSTAVTDIHSTPTAVVETTTLYEKDISATQHETIARTTIADSVTKTQNQGNKSKTGIIAGVVSAVVALIGIGGIVIFILLKKRRSTASNKPPHTPPAQQSDHSNTVYEDNPVNEGDYNVLHQTIRRPAEDIYNEENYNYVDPATVNSKPQLDRGSYHLVNLPEHERTAPNSDHIAQECTTADTEHEDGEDPYYSQINDNNVKVGTQAGIESSQVIMVDNDIYEGEEPVAQNDDDEVVYSLADDI